MKELHTKSGATVLLDDDDYLRLSRYNWQVARIKNMLYAFRDIYSAPRKYRRVYMHREIFGLEAGDRRKIDHRDHNGLNNQRLNIRISTTSQNGANRLKGESQVTSRYKGVCFHRRDNVWQAAIQVDGHIHHIGSFRSETAAAVAYNEAAQNKFGPFALLNNVTQLSE